MSERTHHAESISYAIEGDWLHCPNCGSNQLIGSPVEIVGMLAVQPVSCDHCTTHWHEEYNASRRTGIVWDEEWAEFGTAQDTLDDQGFAPRLEHTGGNVMVLYVRTALNDINVATHHPGAEDVFPISHPFIGITRSEDHTWAEEMWLVMAYEHDDHEGYLSQVVSTDGIGTAVGNLIEILREDLGPLEYDEAKRWAEATLVLPWEADTGTEVLLRQNWHLQRLAHGRTTYNSGAASMTWAIGQLRGAVAGTPGYCVSWQDGIGVNDWQRWFAGRKQAYMFLARLMAAFLTDVVVVDLQWVVIEVADI